MAMVMPLVRSARYYSMPTDKVIIVGQESSRLRYTLDYVFINRYGVGYTLLDPSEYDFSGEEKLVIHYSREPAKGGEKLKMDPLPIMADDFRDFSWRPPSQYATAPEGSVDPGIDVFGLIFFLLSRFEEHDSSIVRDEHNRFPARQSWAFQNKALHLPLVDAWIMELAQLLGIHYEPKFKVKPTYDIDVAYAYHGRPWWRMAGAAAREAIGGRAGDLRRRLSYSLGRSDDPYDTYEFQIALHRELHLEPRYFFLVGNRGPNDRNLSNRSRAMRSLIRRMRNEGGGIALHPSYASFGDSAQLLREKIDLEEIVQSSIDHSRQHYLRLSIPNTYRSLIEAGITDDHTMGYAANYGYRAGTGRPFYWFDLGKNEATTLTIHPFVVMDGTLSDYIGMSPEEGEHCLEEILECARAYRTDFCTLWHNHTLALRGAYQGWRRVYENIIRKAVDLRDGP